MYSILIGLYILICGILIAIVLMQSSKGEGLAGVFGGGGGQALFGGRTGDVLTKATSVLGAAFMVLSLVLALISGRAPRSFIQELQATTGQEASSALDSVGEGALEQPPAAAPASELPPAE
jgi:preprotein translocase subunit SecG